MSDFFKSQMRTHVPVWVSSLAAWLASKGLDLDVDAAVVVAFGLVVSGYYLLARTLEKVPQVAWLGRFMLSVGLVGEPSYQQGRPVAAERGGHRFPPGGRDL
ncbi:hypothetical protein SAMN05421505_12099 [Sinosporangium album]|uniref:Uncharacterized protein n=1 Tax=Sinosporangium album TaxID=504805 RepID=A0A1G8EHE0_9ACTN|nr:hypothetical protein [Sinosporangium album]SDH69210.1 hypothetical protein SAMN05421505_12099 [Sinosporangium album]